MSPLHDPTFMVHFAQCKVSAKQQVNSMIDAIYAKVLLDLELWLNKHQSNHSVHALALNEPTDEQMQFMLTQQMPENVNCPPSLLPYNFKPHSNDSIKSEIDSDCEANVTDHNLPGESPDWQPTTPVPLQPTHSITPHSSSLQIVKTEIDYDEVEVDSKVVKLDSNKQSTSDRTYLLADNEIGNGDFPNIENNRIPKCYHHKVSYQLSQNASTQQPSDPQMHFEDDLEFDQEILDEVKREIKEEEEMKRRENEGEVKDTVIVPMSADQTESSSNEPFNHNLSDSNLNNEQFNDHLHISELNYIDGQVMSELDGDHSNDTARMDGHRDEVEMKEELDETTNEQITTSQTLPLSSSQVESEQSQQLVHIKHNHHDVDYNECVDQNEVMEEDKHENEDSNMQSVSSSTENQMTNFETDQKARAVIIEPNQQPSTQSTSGLRLSTRKRTSKKVFDDDQSNDDVKIHKSSVDKKVQSNQSVNKAKCTIYSREAIKDRNQSTSDEPMAIQQERDAIGVEIATQSTANPVQANFVQPNLHLQCPHCPKSFGHKHNFLGHLRAHTGERPFECDQCDKRFSERGNLARHQLIHQNIRRFRCDQCGKEFTQKFSLENHQRTHSGVRPYQCRFCDKSFTELNTRKRHEQAIHLHVKPYRCKQCGHTAAQRIAIITHIRMVHFGLPQTTKQQRELNIVDERDPRELVEKV